MLSKRESCHIKCITTNETSYIEILKYKGVCEIYGNAVCLYAIEMASLPRRSIKTNITLEAQLFY